MGNLCITPLCIICFVTFSLAALGKVVVNSPSCFLSGKLGDIISKKFSLKIRILKNHCFPCSHLMYRSSNNNHNKNKTFLASGASVVAQMVENLPAMGETRAWSLGLEDPLEKGMATHSTILAWRTPWTEEPGRLQSMGLQRVGPNWATNTFTSLFIFCFPSGNLSSVLISPIYSNAIFTKSLAKCCSTFKTE